MNPYNENDPYEEAGASAYATPESFGTQIERNDLGPEAEPQVTQQQPQQSFSQQHAGDPQYGQPQYSGQQNIQAQYGQTQYSGQPQHSGQQQYSQPQYSGQQYVQPQYSGQQYGQSPQAGNAYSYGNTYTGGYGQGQPVNNPYIAPHPAANKAKKKSKAPAIIIGIIAAVFVLGIALVTTLGVLFSRFMSASKGGYDDETELVQAFIDSTMNDDTETMRLCYPAKATNADEVVEENMQVSSVQFGTLLYGYIPGSATVDNEVSQDISLFEAKYGFEGAIDEASRLTVSAPFYFYDRNDPDNRVYCNAVFEIDVAKMYGKYYILDSVPLRTEVDQ